MTIAAETNKVTYTCDGSKTEFDFTFKVFQTSDVKVVLITVATDAETVLTETTHYAITGSLSSGGKVTTVSTYSSLYKIFITIDIDLDQETDLVYGGSYSSEAIETMSDKLTKIAQQFFEKIKRSITFKMSSDNEDIEIEDLVAGKTIVVNSDGDGLEMGESGGGGGGLDNIVEDTTPQLGGNLDMNGKSIGGSTEAQLDDAVSKKHAESHNAASHSDITSTGADIDDAVSKKHTQLCETADFTKLDALGTASTRNAEDTLTDGANLPDGAAIKTYGDTNWGGGGGGGISWSLINSNTNAVKTNGYLVDASGNNVTLTLPPTPSEGDLVGICDVYNKATTNTITVARNGKNIEGAAEDLVIDSDGSGFTLVYTDVTRGWEIVSEIGGDGGGGVDTFGTPVDNDFAKFTDADTIEGRSYSEVRTDLGIEAGATADQTKADIDGLGLSHDSLVDVSANDHHNESHNAASHSDIASTGTNIDSAVSLKHAATLIGTKTIDETDIGNTKVIAYNSTSGNLEYEAVGTPGAHASSHENAGGDEISVTGLSGLLADDQHVLDTEVLAVAAAKGTNADITSMTGLNDGGIPLIKVAPAVINAQTGTTYTFVLTDSSKLVTFGNASAITVTIPTNASVAFPIGTQIDCIQILAGKATFGGAGVTINSKGGNKAINGQWVGATLIKTATDTWSLLGDLIA